MLDILEEAMEKLGFWIMIGGGTAAILLGWIGSKKAGWMTLPLWQVIVMIIVVFIASVFFATRD